MWLYIVRRLFYGVLVLLGVTAILFVALDVLGGDPALAFVGKSASPADVAAFRQRFGLDEPLYMQYLDYLGQLVRCDFGRSWVTSEPVSELFARRLGPSLSFTLPSLLVTTLLAVSIAMLAAFWRGRAADRSLMALAVLGVSVSFVVYILVFQYLLAFVWPLFPIHGYEPGVITRWQYVALPIVVLVVVGLGYDVRFYRAVFAEEVRRDHVTTAYAKGCSRSRVLFVHVLANSLVPIITQVMISVPFLITGSLLIETFFGIPGIGDLLIGSFNSADFPVLRAITTLGGVVFVMSTVVNDILYAVVDPRIRLS